VTDDGPGIPPDKMERVFEALFYHQGKGHRGSGSPLSNTTPSFYGGAVRVESMLGKGAKIYRKPCPRNYSPKPSAKMTDPLPPVLIVDDEKNMRRSLQNHASRMKGMPCAARRIRRGGRLGACLAKESFLMVINRWPGLGGMSGYDLLGKIRSQWPHLAPPS